MDGAENRSMFRFNLGRVFVEGHAEDGSGG